MHTPRFHHIFVTALLLFAADAVLFPGHTCARTPTLTVLHDFDELDESYPTNGLLLSSDGNVFGTAPTGGIAVGNYSCGTVFRMTPTGGFTTLVKFNVANGAQPISPPFEGSDGNLYGTTAVASRGLF